MAFHLDRATREQFLLIKGVGEASVVKLQQFINNHGSFKSWTQFIGCANQVKFEDMQQMHADGRVISNMPEFAPRKNEVELPDDTQTADESQTQRDEATGGMEAAAGMELPKAAGNLGDALGNGALDQDGDAKLTGNFTDFVQQLSNFNIVLHKFQEDNKDSLLALEKRMENRIAHVNAGLNDQVRKLVGKVDALDLLMRTNSVAEKRSSDKGISYMASHGGARSKTGLPNYSAPGSNAFADQGTSNAIDPAKKTRLPDAGFRRETRDQSFERNQFDKTRPDNSKGVHLDKNQASGESRPKGDSRFGQAESGSDGDNSDGDRYENRGTRSGSNYRNRGKEQSSNNSLAPNKVQLEFFEGKVGEWENWFHKFTFMAEAGGWNDREKLFKLTASLKGNALTAHRNLPKHVTTNFELLCKALQERYGKMDDTSKSVLRADLRNIEQKPDEELEVFSDRVYALTMDAYPCDTPVNQLQMYAVEYFLQGCTDKYSAWLAFNVKNPKTMAEAVAQLKMAQASCKRMGVKYNTRQVSFEEPPTVRQVQRAGNIECHECGGKGHIARDCANRNNGCVECGSSRCNGQCNWRRRSPSPMRRTVDNRRCWECGDFRHLQSECPRRATRGSPARNSREYSPRNRYLSSGPPRSYESGRYSPRRSYNSEEREQYPSWRSDYRSRDASWSPGRRSPRYEDYRRGSERPDSRYRGARSPSYEDYRGTSLRPESQLGRSRSPALEEVRRMEKSQTYEDGQGSEAGAQARTVARSGEDHAHLN